MAQYKTKHMPVDDYPYLVYTSSPDGDLNRPTSVEVLPTSASVAQSGTQTFAAYVAGEGDISQSVTWGLEVESGGTIKSGTAISSAGVLTVAATQATTKKLYVTATASNGVKSAPAVVTVTS